ncbi:hypothetical protein G3I42_16770, partial [Streptomyces sp. SID11385]|nr:hypothetical protein [Streptomyces sp. SID11385]
MSPAPERAVPVTLDLRQYARRPRTGAEVVALWERLEPVVTTVDPRAMPRAVIEVPGEGRVGVWFLSPGTVPVPMDPTTPFAVRGVVEPPRARPACDTCAAEGRETYGPFRCPGCGPKGRGGHVCEEHALFLPGRARATCAR